MKKTVMIAESFDSRTLANMEVALNGRARAFQSGLKNTGFVVISPRRSSNAPNAATEHLAA
jgi:hypothetical protein